MCEGVRGCEPTCNHEHMEGGRGGGRRHGARLCHVTSCGGAACDACDAAPQQRHCRERPLSSKRCRAPAGSLNKVPAHQPRAAACTPLPHMRCRPRAAASAPACTHACAHSHTRTLAHSPPGRAWVPPPWTPRSAAGPGRRGSGGGGAPAPPGDAHSEDTVTAGGCARWGAEGGGTWRVERGGWLLWLMRLWEALPGRMGAVGGGAGKGLTGPRTAVRACKGISGCQQV